MPTETRLGIILAGSLGLLRSKIQVWLRVPKWKAVRVSGVLGGGRVEVVPRAAAQM